MIMAPIVLHPETYQKQYQKENTKYRSAETQRCTPEPQQRQPSLPGQQAGRPWLLGAARIFTQGLGSGYALEKHTHTNTTAISLPLIPPHQPTHPYNPESISTPWPTSLSNTPAPRQPLDNTVLSGCCGGKTHGNTTSGGGITCITFPSTHRLFPLWNITYFPLDISPRKWNSLTNKI